MDKRTKEYKDSLSPEEPMNYLHKTEEVAPVFVEKAGMNDWRTDDKVRSIINTIKILPPNMIRDGRHKIENIQALNVFRVTDELVDKAYENFSH